MQCSESVMLLKIGKIVSCSFIKLMIKTFFGFDLFGRIVQHVYIYIMIRT